MASTRVRTYKEFLTPFQHRRFAAAAGQVLVLCYLESLLIKTNRSFIWSWFPFGPAGFRAAGLFLSSLLVFILRVAQLHLGARTANSGFGIIRRQIFGPNALQTLVFHCLSATVFGEVFVWSAPKSANLSLIAEGKSYERPRLNDRAIYFRCCMLILAAFQTVIHLHDDYDRVRVERVIASPTKESKASYTTKLVNLLPQWAYKVGIDLLATFIGPLIYHFTWMRWTAWSCAQFFARQIWSIPKGAEPSWLPPYSPSLLGLTFWASFLLMTLWDTCNTAFTLNMGEEPLKYDKPLTNDSQDPNGSLLNGLKSKKEIVQTFAFRELACIAGRFEARRKTIYSEIDRSGGSTWSQVMIICLEKMNSIEKRIAEYQNPKPEPLPSSIASQPPQNMVQSLPRLSAPLKEAAIMKNSPRSKGSLETIAGAYVKSLDSPESARTTTLTGVLSPKANQLFNSGRGLLTQQQQEAISVAGVKSTFTRYWIMALRTPHMSMFRNTFERRFSAIVFGTPYSDIDVIVDSVNSVTNLVVHSIKEDKFGCVSPSIPLIIRTYVSIISSLNSFSASLEVHWTDVYYDETGAGRRQEEINTMGNTLKKSFSRALEALGITVWKYTEVATRPGRTGRTMEEAEYLVTQLKSGLREILTAFGRYAEDVGLKASELRAVRRMAEMDK